MPIAGQKNLRGRPELWDETKTRVNLALTPTAVQGLDAQALALGLSRSEFVEKIGRKVITVVTQGDTTDGQ